MDTSVPVEQRVRRTMMLRLIVLLFALYAFFSLDRGNVGLAALEMNSDLGLSGMIYGLGASLFTLAYLVFQVPAVMTMRRLGASRGLSLVACGWGMASMSSAFVWNTQSYLVLRFLLGATEAGFSTFVVFYISQIFPRNMRGLALSMTFAAVPLTMVIASPVSGVLLGWYYAGLPGWRWLFLAEGLPSVLLGVLCLKFIPDSPEKIRFLSVDEREWLAADLEAVPAKDQHQAKVGTLIEAARSLIVWVLGLTLFATVLGTNTLLFWMPEMIGQMSKGSNLVVGWLNAIPWLAFAIGMLMMGRLSDRVINKVGTLSAAMLIAATGFALGGVSHTPALSFVGLLMGAFGVGASMSLFWTVPIQMLSGAAVAGAFATINLIGNSSGVFAHGIIGWIRDHSGGFSAALIALAVIQIAAIILLNLFIWFRNSPSAQAAEALRTESAKTSGSH